MSENAVATAAIAVQMEVAAQRLSFDAGLYLISFNGNAVARVDGIELPRVRIDPLPPTRDMPGRAYIAALSDGQWLDSASPTTFLRIEGGAANVILTTYNMPGETQPPTVRVRPVQHAEAAAALLGAPDAVARRPALLPTGPSEESLPLTLMVHCSSVGDLSVDGGHWAGVDDPRSVIEAFSIAATLEADVAIEYQSIMGVDWSSPWVGSPELSGSRGLALPLFGLRARLVGTQAHEYELVLWARAGDQELGPVVGGEIDPGPDMPLSAIKVALRRRSGPAQAEGNIFSRGRRPRKVASSAA